MKNIEALKAENKRLQEAVDQQTSELLEKNRALEIEASLEKVRTVAMGMKKPEDMLDVCRVISAQLQHFGVSNIRNIQTAIIDENIGQYLCYQYFTPYDKTIIEKTEYLKSPVEHDMVKQMLASQDAYFTNGLKGKELDEFRNHRKNENHFPDPLLDETSELEYCFLSIGRGGLGLTLYSTLDEAVLNLFKRFHEVFSLAYQRFRDIQKAEDQAREARIEAALERLRSRSLAMQKSEELAEASVLLEEEIRKLGIENWGCAFHIYDEETTDGTPWDLEWFTSMAGLLPFYKTPRENVFLNYYEESKKGNPLYIQEFGPEVIKEHYDYLKSLPVLGDALTELHNSGVPLPARQIDHVAFFNHGHLLFITYKPVPEAHDIFIRFAKAFNQAYTRFLDLQKAEEQAREAEIELALERVRSRSLAMHATTELQDVIHTVHQELLKLDIGILGGSFIAINSEIEKELHCWGSGGTADTSDEVHIPYFDKPFYTNLVKGLKSGPAFFTEEFTQEEKKEFFTFLFTQEPWSNLKANEKKEILSSPGGYTRSCCVSLNTSIFIINQLGIKFSEEENGILKRFGKVFDQAYTRFLDLQKAEAQAREARIEAALEKVRSRSLAMHKSDELNEVVSIVFEKLKELQIPATAVGIGIAIEGSKDLDSYVCGENEAGLVITNYRLPHFDNPIPKDLYNSLEKQMEFFVANYSKAEKDSFYNYVIEHTAEFKHLPEDILRMIFDSPTYTISMVAVKNAVFNINDFEGKVLRENEIDIIKRFAKVFDQAYTRFLDLQKAEAQAREARIEAALERVRSRSLAMHKTEELADAIVLLQRELAQLEFALDNCIFWIIDKESNEATIWVAPVNNTNLPEPYQVPFTNLPYFREVFQAWELRNPKWTYVLEDEDKKRTDEYLLNETGFRNFPDDLKKIFLLVKKTNISISFYKYGGLHVSTEAPINELQGEILSRFSKVFDQTYTRFLDLQKAEAQAREAQISLAVERVRARALAMFKSDEILEVVFKLKEEIMRLDIPGVAAAAILLKEKNGKFRSWDLTSFEMNGKNVHLPLDIPFEMEKTDPGFYLRKVWKEGSAYSVIVQDEKSLQISCNWLREHHKIKEAKEAEQILKSAHITKSYHPTYPLNQGRMILDLLEPPSQEIESILSKMGGAFDLAYKRFEDLEKAEAQAKEAKIEASLERVRSRSMAMHKTDELQEVVRVVAEELKNTGVILDTWGAVICTYFQDSKDVLHWTASENPDNPSIAFLLPYFKDELYDEAWASKNRGDSYFAKVFSFDVKNAFFKHAFEHSDYRQLPDDYKKLILESESHGIAWAWSKNSAIMIPSIQGDLPSEGEKEILIRFVKVFEQSFIRFLDLQKAEAQARESEIQLALERVRARTMAMQKSEELADVAFILFEQLRSLGGNLWGTGFGLCEENSEKDEFWFANENGIFPPVAIPNTSDPAHKRMYKGWQEKTDFLSIEKSGKALNDHYEYMLSLPEVRPFFQKIIDEGLSFPENQEWNAAYFSKGYLLIITLEPYPDKEILKRFAKVFEQTYTRFLDLQKAEAQAREAEVELALERVRARTMAMQNSDELAEVSSLLFLQMKELGVTAYSSGFTIWDEYQDKLISWVCNADGSLNPPFYLPMTEEPWHREQYESWKKGEDFTVKDLAGEDWKAYFRYLRSFPLLDKAFATSEAAGHPMPLRQVHHAANFSHGNLLFITLEPRPEAHELFKRFAKVFEQTYTRFLDLQKAEAQAKQARIEAALERIRGQVASMRESSELLEIMVSMRKEFVDLGHEAHYFWHMRWLPDTYEKAMTSGDGTQVGMVMSLPRQIHGDIKAVADWEKGKDPLFVLAMEAEAAVDYVHKMITWGDFEQVDPQAPSLDDVRHIGGLTFIMARTTHGEIGYSLPGSVPNPPQESLDTLVRFAKVFGLAYKRFEDLKKAEHQARETLIELALERVRSRSMGMQKSEELQEVIQVVYQQFIGLGIPIQHTGFIMDYKNREDMNIWLADSNQFHSEITFPYFDSPHWNSFVEAKAKGEDFFTNLLDFDAKNSFYKVLFEFIPDLPKEKQDFYFAQEGLSISTVLLDNVGLYIENYTITPFTEEENRVLMRFGKVFQQTYTRFLDLQKAEKQALVAKIEASLERVRAQTMAMHNSEDVGKCIVMMFEELTALGVNEKTRFGIGILNHENENNQLWTARKEGGEFKLHIGHLEMSWHPLLKSARKAWKAQESLHRYILEGEDLVNYYQMLNQAPDYRIQIDIEKLPEREFHYGFVFEHGFFYAFCPDEFSQDNIDLIHRFSAQFAQTYRRYLDLKKAEAQAKEAKIEAALEKVRSRTMGMQHSDELPEAANVLFTEVRKLGIPAWSCGYNILSKDLKSSMCWMSSENEIQEPFRLPLTEHESMLPWHKAITTNQSFFVYEQGGEDLVEHYLYLGNLPELKSVFAQFEAANISLPTFQVNHLARFEQGFLLFITYERVPEDHTIFQRFTKVFEQTYTRFLDLQKAEAQAKESKIEAALERIRSRSLAMHHSSELSAVVDTLLQEFTKLEFTLTFCIINLIDEQDMSNTVWAANPETGKDPESYYMKFEDYPFHHAMWDAWKSQKKRFIYTIEGEEKKIYDEYLYSETEFRRFPKHVQDANKALERYVAGFTFFKFSGLQTVSEDYISEDDLNILERFGRVFEQAYTRFLDLQKAEAQAREAQIEAALERVRSRTLGMQKAEELGDVATVLFGELNTLVENLWTCGFVLCEKDSKEDEWWLSLDNGLIQPFSLPNEGDFAHKTLYEGWEKSESYRTVTLENKQLQEHYEWLMNLPVAKQIFEEMEDSGIPRPKWQRLHAAYFKTGYLVIITEVPCAEEDIFKRFAQVFDLTYTRFLDLTKAEAQAKEAKLELSLQRIRAQVTSMTHSDELFDIVVSMRKEFISLGNEADYFWHMKWTPANYEMSMTSEDGERVGMIISVPKFVHDEIPRLAEWEKSDSPLMALDLNGKEAWDYMDKMNTYGKYEQADPHAPSEEDILAIGGLTFVIARTTHGEIGFSLPGQVPNPPKESIETLIRFAAVFDLAYRRFEDLLTAEKQNRKAKIELALERVRARAMAMQEPEELIEVAQVMREEMGVLGVEELETSSIYLNKDTTGKAECWYSIKDIRDGAKTYLADHFDLRYQDTWVGGQMLNFYQSEESKTSILMKGENRVEWINYCAKKSPKLQGYYGTEIPERTYHLTKFSNGAIGAATPGEISGESWDLLRRAALVFSLAYSRFKDLSQARDDLKSLKKAKAKAEKALKELKSAQEQLVQQEKLASLGQLTAGIAHEIKNPLNFVNNFSDLSRELIEEVFEELENLADSETKQEIIAILNDVRSNLTKVHEHGSRADGIVTSMLQHSRASGNKSESKAINPIIKEFVNLSFHGMRAAKSPINVTIDLQLGEEVGNLNIVSEDFSRVILNLCNNAFDAMRDKLNAQPSGTYEAKLMVTSYCSNRKIILEFKDNGPGIPKENIDKILQPFFTTKKGTAGTGLGLSITHDIIKAHRGNLQIKSTVGEGTTMSIILPIDSE